MTMLRTLRTTLVFSIILSLPAQTFAGAAPRIVVSGGVAKAGMPVSASVSGAAVIGTQLQLPLHAAPNLDPALEFGNLAAPQVSVFSQTQAGTLAVPEEILAHEAALPESLKKDGEQAGLVELAKTASQKEGVDLQAEVGEDVITVPEAEVAAEGQKGWARSAFQKLLGRKDAEAVDTHGIVPNDSGLLPSGDLIVAPEGMEVAVPESPARGSSWLDRHPQVKETGAFWLEALGPAIGTAFFMGSIYLAFTYLPLMMAIATVPMTISIMAKPMKAFHKFQDARLEARYAADVAEEAERAGEQAQEQAGEQAQERTGEQAQERTGEQAQERTGEQAEEQAGDQAGGPVLPEPVVDPVDESTQEEVTAPETEQPVEKPADEEKVVTQPVEDDSEIAPPPAKKRAEKVAKLKLSHDARTITGTALRAAAEKALERAVQSHPARKNAKGQVRLVEARIALDDQNSHWVFVFETKHQVITVWGKRLKVEARKGRYTKTLPTRNLSSMGNLEELANDVAKDNPEAKLMSAQIKMTKDGARYTVWAK